MILEQALVIAGTGFCADPMPFVTKEEVYSSDLKLLHRILVSPHASLALQMLETAGFFIDLIPEIKKSIELKSPRKFKKIWPHTLQVINQTPPELNSRWAALFHDLGKADTFYVKNGKVTFHHHESASAKKFMIFAKKSGIFTPGQKTCIKFLISHLGYIEGYRSSWTDSGVRRLIRETGIYLNDLLILAKADITTKNIKKRDRVQRNFQELESRIEKLKKEDLEINVLPKGLGHKLIEIGIPKGPEVGKVRLDIEERIKSGELLGNQEIDYYIGFVKGIES